MGRKFGQGLLGSWVYGGLFREVERTKVEWSHAVYSRVRTEMSWRCWLVSPAERSSAAERADHPPLQFRVMVEKVAGDRLVGPGRARSQSLMACLS